LSSIQDSVQIPLSELGNRVHELPSRTSTIQVANVDSSASDAVDWLTANGRTAILGNNFVFGESERTRLWSPNLFLEQCAPKIPPGRVLDAACGSGRDSVFLASCGFEVTAIDHLEDALAMGKDLERRYIPNCVPIDWRCLDLNKNMPTGRFDLIACFFYLNRGLMAKVRDLLNPGGHLVMETFTTVHREKFGKPRSEGYALKPNELLRYADGMSVIEYEEDWHEGRHTARMWAHEAGS